MLARLGLSDMEEAAAVMRESYDAALPWLAGRHTPEQDQAFFRGILFPACEIWGIKEAGALTGFIAMRNGWVDQLYVLPRCQHLGYGTGLLAIAKETFPRLELWTFQRNQSARAFYQKHGFLEVERTDGAANEENEPDIRFKWL